MLVVPVDLPCLSRGSLKSLLLKFGRHGTAVTYLDVWLPAVIPLNESLVDTCAKVHSVENLLRFLGSVILENPPPDFCLNTNTPQEWKRAEGLHEHTLFK
jgi:molybdopterin-guanine dinucleotide biosynthesis protein A